MFRRHWSGLPRDASFPNSLEGIGYTVHDNDEIRSTKNSDNYFKFFINKTDRVNIRQRFALHRAVEKIIHERLEQAGLCKMAVPLGTHEAEPHMPIFVSRNLDTKSRVVVFFGEPTQGLGLLAHRVMEGPGGLNEGSMVSVIRAVEGQRASVDDASPPGVILANTGETYWWPEEKCALSVSQSAGIPLPSLAHYGRTYVPALNDIPNNRDSVEHIKYMFEKVIPKLTAEHAMIDIVAIGESCEIVEQFLDQPENWAVWGKRLSAMLLMGTVYPTDTLTNPEFKQFLAKRTCGYGLSSLPVGTGLAPPIGNPNESIPELGCPIYSSGEPHYIELILIRARDVALAYLQAAAMSPQFENVPIVVVDRPQEEFTEDTWKKLPEDEKPCLTKADPEVMQEQVKQALRWKKFADTGMAPESSDEEDDAGASLAT